MGLQGSSESLEIKCKIKSVYVCVCAQACTSVHLLGGKEESVVLIESYAK